MKLLLPILLFSLLIFNCSVAHCQFLDSLETKFRRNEIKINLSYTIVEIIELTYERHLADELAAGLALSVWFNDNDRIQYMANPYFRFYPFPYKPSAGFFIEGNAAIAQTLGRKAIYIQNNFRLDEVKTLRAGAGFAAGFKFVSRGSFVGEAHLGAGRLFNDDSKNGGELFYPRVGITFGKRF